MKTLDGREINVSQADSWTLADCSDVLEATQATMAKITERRVKSVTDPLRENGFALNEFYGLQGDLRDASTAGDVAEMAMDRIEALFGEFREKRIAERRRGASDAAHGGQSFD
jgi:hypothetical protein